jgi:hypothetical protein
MAIDPSISLGVKPLEIASPLAQYGQVAQLQNMQTQNQLHQMQMQEAQTAAQERNALRQLNPNAADYEAQLFRVNPQLGIAYRKEASAAMASKAQQQSHEAATAQKKQEMLGQAYRDISSRPSDANITAHLEDVLTSPMYSDAEKAHVQARADELLKLPFVERQTTLAQQGAKASELKPAVHVGPSGAFSTPAFGGAATPIAGAEGAFQMTPYQKAQVPIQQGQLAVSQGQLAVAQQRLAKEGAQLDPAETAAVSQAIVEGRLDPNRVNGRNAKLLAATLMANPNANVLELGVAAAGATASEKSLATQTAKMSTAATEANQMADIVRNLSNKVDRTEFPTLNAVQNAVSKGTGDQNIVKLNTSINALVNSYARAISPTGAPTVSDKNHAREVINSAYSQGQLGAILDVMQQEMGIAKSAATESSANLKAAREATKGRGAVSTEAPKAGSVQNGYRFKGGNPADQSSWEKL